MKSPLNPNNNKKPNRRWLFGRLVVRVIDFDKSKGPHFMEANKEQPCHSSTRWLSPVEWTDGSGPVGSDRHQVPDWSSYQIDTHAANCLPSLKLGIEQEDPGATSRELFVFQRIELLKPLGCMALFVRDEVDEFIEGSRFDGIIIIIMTVIIACERGLIKFCWTACFSDLMINSHDVVNSLKIRSMHILLFSGFRL